MSAAVSPAQTALEGSEPCVRTERIGPVVRLVLARPARYNVLSRAMMAELKAALEAIAQDASIRVVVLVADGRAFCAGHDLTEMEADVDRAAMRELFARCTDLMMTIRRLPQPVIARVQGVATAAGCQLVAMCDLAVASSDARFAVSGINLGLFCSTPAVALSRNLLQKPALEMLLTGDFIDAQTARERGLINRVAGPDALDAEIEALASSIVAKSAAAVTLGKQLFYTQREMSIEAAYELAGDVMAENATLDDARRGIARFTQRRG